MTPNPFRLHATPSICVGLRMRIFEQKERKETEREENLEKATITVALSLVFPIGWLTYRFTGE
jgi:glucose uptake protein GlcU